MSIDRATLSNLSRMVYNMEAKYAKKGEIVFNDLAAALQAVISGKADAATTLAGYGITDAMTATQIENAIAAAIGSTYKPAGTIAGSELVDTLLVAANNGKVYNISSDLAITAQNEDLFANLSAGDKVKAGDDVGVIAVEVEEGGETTTVYLFNDFAGFVDLSGYSTTQEMNSAIAAAIADKIELTDLSIATATGAGNVITGLSYDSTTGEFTPNKGITALTASDFTEYTDAQIDALWNPSSGD